MKAKKGDIVTLSEDILCARTDNGAFYSSDEVSLNYDGTLVYGNLAIKSKVKVKLIGDGILGNTHGGKTAFFYPIGSFDGTMYYVSERRFTDIQSVSEEPEDENRAAALELIRRFISMSAWHQDGITLRQAIENKLFFSGRTGTDALLLLVKIYGFGWSDVILSKD